jgi:hypothetical protein
MRLIYLAKRNITTGLFGLQFPALNGVAVGNQILENVLLAFKMSGNYHFQIKWLDNLEYKKMAGCGK